jgi:acetoin utilization deacetylase AcuC-like enzyme
LWLLNHHTTLQQIRERSSTDIFSEWEQGILQEIIGKIEESISMSAFGKLPPQDLDNVAIFSHRDCVDHCIPNHVERPQRVTSILKFLQEKWKPHLFYHSTEVSDEQILLFHEEEHLLELKASFLEAETKNKIVKIDGDTQICPQTKSAVLHSAGSIINAIDRMYLPKDHPEWLRSLPLPSAPLVFVHKSNCRTAYCCVRPPGHHATPSRAMGFCFLNNAGIGARYAQEKFGVERVAVLVTKSSFFVFRLC